MWRNLSSPSGPKADIATAAVGIGLSCRLCDRQDCRSRAFPPIAHRLTIDPERLTQIRNERRPNSKYAALDNCRYEVREAEAMMKRNAISWLSSTHKSIEEIAATILRDIRPDKLIY